MTSYEIRSDGKSSSDGKKSQTSSASSALSQKSAAQMGSERAEYLRKNLLETKEGRFRNESSKAWKRERILRFERMMRNEKIEDDRDETSNASSLVESILSFGRGMKITNSSQQSTPRSSSASASAKSSRSASPRESEMSQSNYVSKISKMIGNFGRYGSSATKNTNDDDDDGDDFEKKREREAKSNAAFNVESPSPRNSSEGRAESPQGLPGIEEDAVYDDKNTSPTNSDSHVSSPMQEASGYRKSSNNSNKSSSKSSSKSPSVVTFGVPQNLSNKEQKKNDKKRDKEFEKYLEGTTKGYIDGKSKDDEYNNDGFFWGDIDGSPYGFVSRKSVHLAVLFLGSFAFGGASYAFFDPRGNSKMFGDTQNESNGDDNAFRAIALFGAVLGAAASGYTSDHFFGRKNTLSISGGIAAAVWAFCFGVADSNGSVVNAPAFVPVAVAFLGGLTCASWFAVAPVLISETLPANDRGRFFVVTVSLAAILGAILSGELFNLIQPNDTANDKFYMVLLVLMFMTISMGSFAMTIESPRWLLSRGRVIDAQHSCSKLSGSNAMDSLDEMEQIRADLDSTSPAGSTSRFTWLDLLTKKKFSTAFFVCLTLIAMQTFGTASFFTFTEDETDASATRRYLYAYFCVLFGVILCAWRIDDTNGFLPFGRKSLVVCSFFILALANSIRFIVAVVDDNDPTSDLNTTVITFCNCFGAFGYGIGACSLPLLFATEWFPQHARQASLASICASSYAMFLLASLMEDPAMYVFGDIVVFLTKSIVSVIGVCCAIFCVYETAQTSLELAHVFYLRGQSHSIVNTDEERAVFMNEQNEKAAYDAIKTHAEQSRTYSGLKVKTSAYAQ